MTGYLHGLYLYIAVMAWVFVILYGTRKWYTSAAGWNYMLFQLCMGVMFTVLAIPGDGDWRMAVWLGGLVVIAAVVTHRVVLVAHDIYRDRTSKN